MPSKKKKYNARFPPARIKKIMQSDEEVGKVAQAVPVIISRVLELFVESLLGKAAVVTGERNAKTMMPGHLKQCILAEQRFDFLKDIVSTVPDGPGGSGGGLDEPPTPSLGSGTPLSAPPSAGPQDLSTQHQLHQEEVSPFQFPVVHPNYYGSVLPNFYGSGSVSYGNGESGSGNHKRTQLEDHEGSGDEENEDDGGSSSED